MPEASSTPSDRPHPLKKHQACLPCRRKKQKCDAARPYCRTCVDKWEASKGVPAPVGFAHPAEPQCTYYTTTRSRPADKQRKQAEYIRKLGEQVLQLENELKIAKDLSTSPASCLGRTLSPDSNIPSPTHPELPTWNPHEENIKIHGHTEVLALSNTDPSLPEPEVLDQLVDAFFQFDPCSSRVLHQPSFRSSLRLQSKDLSPPHPAILHAICASASRWTSPVATLNGAATRADFVKSHADKTREYIARLVTASEDAFPILQANIILAWHFYREGQSADVWVFSAFHTRLAVFLRLNYPGTFRSVDTGGNSLRSMLVPPTNMESLELRRRVLWAAFMLDRIASVGGLPHSIGEGDIGTELPSRDEDFDSLSATPQHNPQHLSSPNVFTEHPDQYTDSFILFLKAVMLYGRVTDFSTRRTLRSRGNTPDHEGADVQTFQELDQLVSHSFRESFPPKFRDIMDEGAKFLDACLYMAHVVPYAATITLHDPFAKFHQEADDSRDRCVHAAESIVSAYHRLVEAGFDITQLNPFVVTCWYLAGAVFGKTCRYYINTRDSFNERRTWDNLNILRHAMTRYGSRSRVGTMQEALLRNMLADNLQSTLLIDPLSIRNAPHSGRPSCGPGPIFRTPSEVALCSVDARTLDHSVSLSQLRRVPGEISVQMTYSPFPTPTSQATNSTETDPPAVYWHGDYLTTELFPAVTHAASRLKGRIF